MKLEAMDSYKKEKLVGTVLITGVSVSSALFGFSHAVTAAKKQQPDHFTRGLNGATMLGLRAFALGSLAAVLGVGGLTVVTCAILGVKSPKEFRYKMESLLKPRVPLLPRNNPPGRSDFSSFRELFEYLNRPAPTEPTSDSSTPKVP